MRCGERSRRSRRTCCPGPRGPKPSESCLAVGCNKPTKLTVRKPARWCETTGSELTRGGFLAYDMEVGNSMGNGASQSMSEAGRSCRRIPWQADVFRHISARRGIPVGEGKSRRACLLLIPNQRHVRAFRIERPCSAAR